MRAHITVFANHGHSSVLDGAHALVTGGCENRIFKHPPTHPHTYIHTHIHVDRYTRTHHCIMAIGAYFMARTSGWGAAVKVEYCGMHSGPNLM